MPTALITGGTGFLGSYVVRALRTLGWTVVATHVRVPVRSPPPGDGVRVEQLEIRDASAVDRLVRSVEPDVIYHFAGQAYVVPSWDDPGATFDVNLSGTLHLLEAIRRSGRSVRLAFAGSGTEYGEPEEVPTPESAPLLPTSPYAVSKAAADLLCYQYHRSYGLPVFRLRIFGTTGVGKRGDVCNDFASQLARLENDDAPPVLRVGALDKRRDIMDVRDAVGAMVRIVERGTPGEAYNIGRGEATRIRDLLDTLLRFARRTVTVEEEPARLRRVDEPAHIADIARLRALGWSATIPLAESLEQILNDWRTRTPVAVAAGGSPRAAPRAP